MATAQKQRLPNYIAYVERQKEHHAKGTTLPILERADGGTSSLILREAVPAYQVEDADWRRELEALEEVWLGGRPAGDVL